MQHDTHMTIALPDDVRPLLEAPNYVHLSTLMPDGAPKVEPVWVAREGDRVLVTTDARSIKARNVVGDPRVALSVVDRGNPYRMAALQGRVVEERPDEGCRLMDPISIKYTGAPFPSRGPDRVCFVIAVEKAAQHTLNFVHRPGAVAAHQGAQAT